VRRPLYWSLYLRNPEVGQHLTNTRAFGGRGDTWKHKSQGVVCPMLSRLSVLEKAASAHQRQELSLSPSGESCLLPPQAGLTVSAGEQDLDRRNEKHFALTPLFGGGVLRFLVCTGPQKMCQIVWKPAESCSKFCLKLSRATEAVFLDAVHQFEQTIQ